MAEVTFQVLEGMERGRIFADLPTPLTIGREEDNGIQLNDERVSRFHLKIQEDAGHVILTDLESTNGTRVNGVPSQLRVLQIGDLISIGRCLLVYGSPKKIAERFLGSDPSSLSRLQEVVASSSAASSDEKEPAPGGTVDAGSESPSDWNDLLERAYQRLGAEPPPLPDTFRLAQQAQLADLIAYIHQRLLSVLQSGCEASERDPKRVVEGLVWQQLIDLEMRLAQLLREVGDPGTP
jgi:predicted component of type VI protein secretion system